MTLTASMIPPRVVESFFSRVEKAADRECWLWTGCVRSKKAPYGKVNASINGVRVQLAHRLSFIIHNGAIDNSLCVLHSCDNPRCVNPNHLKQGTQSENVADAASKGRMRSPKLFGERHPSRKLTELQVLAIRDSQETEATLSKQFNVSGSLIGNIRRREIWKHI